MIGNFLFYLIIAFAPLVVLMYFILEFLFILISFLKTVVRIPTIRFYDK